MGTTNYINLGSSIIGEESIGGSRVDYATDAIGSVTGTLVASALQNVYFYNPYGSLLQKSGFGADSTVGWCGTAGYRQTNRVAADVYVRARTYSTSALRWLERDPLWPEQQAYAYAGSGPISLIDASGLYPWDACGFLHWMWGPTCSFGDWVGCELFCFNKGKLNVACFKVPASCIVLCSCIGILPVNILKWIPRF